jgi:hypothetical protein
MRLIGAAVGLSLCLACVVDREIGEAFDTGDLTQPGAPGELVPPMRAPPPLPSNEPCCAVQQPLALDDPESQASPPHVVLESPGRWAVTWQDFNRKLPVIRMVEGDTPGAAQDLGPGAPDLTPTSIGHYLPTLSRDSGRYMLALQPSFRLNWPEVDHNARVVLVDHHGDMLAEAVIPGASEGGTIVQADGMRALAMVVLDHPEGSVDRARLILLDDNLAPVGNTVDLGASLPDDSQSASVLAVDGKLVTVIAAPDGVHVRTFASRALTERHPEVKIEVGTTTNLEAPLGRDGRPYNAVSPVSSVTAAVVWDLVVIAAMDRLTIRTWVYQPATGSLLAGPTVVGTSTHMGRLNMGGDIFGGTAGLCFSVGDGPGNPDGLQFALVGPDGKPRGLPVTIASGLTYVATCDVAAGGPDEYLVTYWNAAKETPRPSILANRVLVQRGTGLAD